MSVDHSKQDFERAEAFMEVLTRKLEVLARRTHAREGIREILFDQVTDLVEIFQIVRGAE